MLPRMPSGEASATEREPAETTAFAHQPDQIGRDSLARRAGPNAYLRAAPLDLDRLDPDARMRHAAGALVQHIRALVAAGLLARGSREQVLADCGEIAPGGRLLEPLDHACDLFRGPRDRLCLPAVPAAAAREEHAYRQHADRGLHGARIFSLGMEGS